MHKYTIYDINNMKDLKKSIINDIQTKHILNEESSFNINLILSELIINSLKHAGTSGKINISLDNNYDKDKISIIIEDFGKGFIIDNVKINADKDKIYDKNGRGLIIIHSLCESVYYNDSGNSVLVVIKL
jgi:anti-sigma regulatory factor (Ser/Thr protein kinase)